MTEKEILKEFDNRYLNSKTNNHENFSIITEKR